MWGYAVLVVAPQTQKSCHKCISSSQPGNFRHSAFWNVFLDKFANSEIHERVTNCSEMEVTDLPHTIRLHPSTFSLQSSGRLENEATINEITFGDIPILSFPAASLLRDFHHWYQNDVGWSVFPWWYTVSGGENNS